MTVANVNVRQILLKRGNTAVTSQYVGPVGEIVLDTDLETIRVQDGVTPGGQVILVNHITTDLINSNVANLSAYLSGNVTAINLAIATLQSTVYSNANVAAYLPLDPTITAIQGNLGGIANSISTITGIDATFAANINTLLANAANQEAEIAGVSSAWQANAAVLYTDIQTLNQNELVLSGQIANLSANVDSFESYANATYVAQTALNTLDANVGAYEIWANNAVATIESNVGAFESYANLTIAALDANVGAYEVYANTAITSVNANLGAFETYANASITSIDANVGAYETWANANVSALYTSITNTDANLAAANTAIATLQSEVYSNTNVSAYLLGTITTGNILPAANITYNLGSPTQQWHSLYVSANTIYMDGVPVSVSGTTLKVNGNPISGNYGDSNVAAYLASQNMTSYGNTQVSAYLSTATINTTGNITAAYVKGNGSQLTGINYNSVGNITGTSSNVTLVAGSYNWTFDNTGNLTIPATGNILYANGAVFSSGSNYGNTQVAAYLLTNTGNISAGNIITTGNITAANFIGNIVINGNVQGTSPNVQLVAGSYTTTFDSTGNITLPNVASVYINSVYPNGNIVFDPQGTGSVGIGSDLNVGGNVSMPNRSAFRVYGSGNVNGLSTTVNSNGYLNGYNWAVDYSQGAGVANISTGSTNSTTAGVFVAPVAGLYQVCLNARNGGNLTSYSQIAVIKNPTTTSNVQVMLEFGANCSMNHTGGSTISRLAAGDTLAVKVLAGTVTFDANDSWAVAYIG